MYRRRNPRLTTFCNSVNLWKVLHIECAQEPRLHLKTSCSYSQTAIHIHEPATLVYVAWKYCTVQHSGRVQREWDGASRKHKRSRLGKYGSASQRRSYCQSDSKRLLRGSEQAKQKAGRPKSCAKSTMHMHSSIVGR